MRAVPTRPPAREARADDRTFAVVASRFNGAIVEKLVEGAVDTLTTRGAASGDVHVLWVPGALELPLAAQRALDVLGVHAVVCVGCVIQGGTDHYQHVCRATVDGIQQVSLAQDAVVTNGVLTVATLAQAEERAGGAHGNKGAEAAAAAVELLDLLARLEDGEDGAD
ncbi:MAG: 6,7-dimethyl-8-ribityllumazine synthase [Deltaproteobacteria bacterium]|nr:6,7-dimethyl-8-ribityllumazine synthase [Deltaproteobacteria bacterium]